MAARLSESGRHRVLLLEAGPPDTNPWIHIPLGFAKTYVNPQVNWKFETEPQPQLANRRLYLPRGKTLGGSSSINGMVYMRGSHGDYDEWRQRGCEGWDWDSVCRFSRRPRTRRTAPTNSTASAARCTSPTSPAASNWPTRCWRPPASRHPAQPRLQRRVAGRLRLLPDHQQQQPPLEHRESLSGTGAPAAQPDDPDRRPRDARADREPPRRRRRIPYPRWPPHRARRRRDHRLRRRLRLPQLLLLSGLGPAQHLQDMGIDVVRDMPAVGANLHDHFNSYVSWRCTGRSR